MFRLNWYRLSFLLVLAMQISQARAQSKNEIETGLVPIVQGNRLSSFGDQPDKFRQTPVYEAAQRCGVDLSAPDHPLVICSFKNRRLFYLFYNVVTNVPDSKANASPPYLIQRVKRTVINYPRNGAPETKVDYLVETMKTLDGRMKSPDQHYSSTGIHDFEKRRIEKEFEIGVGEIEGIAPQGPWPFEARILYKQIQSYQPEAAAYDKCRFTKIYKWTLAVEFDALGNYSMTSPKLGIELVHRLPEALAGSDPTDSQSGISAIVETASKKVVLQEGQGVSGLLVGKSRLEDVKKKYGEPSRVQAPTAGAKNYEFSNGLTFNIYNGGTINSIFTQQGFLGKTSKGTRHGDTRAKVSQVYGSTKSQGRTQTHDGIIFWFDANDQVEKMVVYRRTAR